MMTSLNFWLFMVLGLDFWLLPVLPVKVRGGLFADGLLVSTLLAVVSLQGLIERRFRLWSFAAALVIVAAIVVEEVYLTAAYIEKAAFAASFAAATELYFHTLTLSLLYLRFANLTPSPTFAEAGDGTVYGV